ncbi:hypothetical protein MtrunA17_Chr4g0012491 [Medicago truncatula]|uniref:Uncharacterized protein n=1 Tax=Medicago truncatula TaxID=3880 RepID=A0A396I3I6_MEDTR|nr:hypothetical protein MtrunA17_Chr4g0012491 [Medicago truncatula]
MDPLLYNDRLLISVLKVIEVIKYNLKLHIDCFDFYLANKQRNLRIKRM